MTKITTQQTLTPEMKAWLDRVIVPALVHEFLAEMESKKELAERGAPDIESCEAVSGGTT